jgi:hypothetical protein
MEESLLVSVTFWYQFVLYTDNILFAEMFYFKIGAVVYNYILINDFVNFSGGLLYTIIIIIYWQTWNSLSLMSMYNYVRLYWWYIGVAMVVIIWELDLQLPVQSVPITTNVVSLNPVHGKMYSIQHYVIKFVGDLRQICVFLWVLRFPPSIKLTATI